MKKISATILLVILFAFSPKAQVMINEYSCANWMLSADNYSSYEDWIELYNPSASAVNIGNFYLSDNINQPAKWRFPANVMISANSYLKVWASGRNEVVGNDYHTNFHMTQTKFPSEEIVLSDASGSILDQVNILATQVHQSRGRIPNGGANWNIFTVPTPGAANNTASSKQRYAATPVFSVNPGFYNSSLTVSISTTEPNSQIYYTLNGDTPTLASALYNGPITIDSTKVLKAITYSSTPSIFKSTIGFGTYFINDFHTLPVVSIAGNQLDVLANGNGGLKPIGTIEYYDINRHLKTAGVGEFNRHGQDSWALDQRSLDFIMRDEFGYNYALQEQLFNLTTRSEFQRVILRAAGDDNYPAAHHSSNAGSAHLRDAYVENLAKTGGLDLDVRIATKCIIYLNGVYWGVYDLREIPDEHDYTKYYYNQDKYNLQMIETWGGTWSEYGGNQAQVDWQNLHNYIMAGNMNNPATWDSINSQLDINSLADYVIFNSVTVCSDWLNYNTAWWRGMDPAGQHRKWGYDLWDNDAVFGFYINFTGIPDKGPFAKPCNVESGLSDPENHIDLLNKLRQNTGFNNYYISRYIDLTNTVFSCSNMLNTLDSLKAVIDPEMTRHAARWSGTYTEWNNNYQQLRNFVQQRCSAFPALMDTCYNLTGPYPLYITADPIGTGKIQINSLTISNFPWTGNYHGGIPVLLTAYPDTLNSFTFDRWESNHNTVVPSVYLVNAQMNISTSDTLIAHFLQHTVSINEKENNFDAIASPSVFSKETNINYYQKDNSKISIMLYSILGKPVLNILGNNSAGSNQFSLDFSGKGIPPGLYLLNFKSEKFNKTIRLVYTGE